MSIVPVAAQSWYDEENDTDYHSIIGTHFYNQRSFIFYSSVSPDKVPEADWKRFLVDVDHGNPYIIHLDEGAYLLLSNCTAKPFLGAQ